MSQSINTPCSKCGAEAATPTGCIYIGKSILDPESRPVCKPCHDKWEQEKKNKVLQFEYTEEGNNSRICRECGGLISVGFAGRHAIDVHHMRRYEFVRK